MGPLQLSFATLAQTSSYATGCCRSQKRLNGGATDCNLGSVSAKIVAGQANCRLHVQIIQ